MKKRLKVEEAAKLLEVPPQFLRIALQMGKYPFGFAIKTSSQYTYYINAPQLEEYLRQNRSEKVVQRAGERRKINGEDHL